MSQARSYLDHAASAPLLPEARTAMEAAWGLVGNPHALHASGRGARRVLEESRERLAADLGARPSEVLFTSGGTEANNLALLGGLATQRAGSPQRRRLAISSIEHPSVDAVRVKHPEAVDLIEVDTAGRVVPASAEAAITEATALVSVMAVNNETGVVQPVEAVVALAGSAGALIHSDAVQALGHVPLSFAGLDLDLMSLAAHKVGGPVGVGALVIRRGVELSPQGFGGGQERRLRSGTVPVALAVGFAAAVSVAVAGLDQEAARLQGLRDRLAGGLVGLPGVRINGAGQVSPAILNVGFAGIRADDLLLLLDQAGIDASTGSACSAGVHQPSPVLKAMGRPPADCAASLRFSLGRATNQTDVDRLLGVLPTALDRARAAFA